MVSATSWTGSRAEWKGSDLSRSEPRGALPLERRETSPYTPTQPPCSALSKTLPSRNWGCSRWSGTRTEAKPAGQHSSRHRSPAEQQLPQAGQCRLTRQAGEEIVTLFIEAEHEAYLTSYITVTLVRLGWVQGGCVRTDSCRTAGVDSSTRSYLPKLFSEPLSAGFPACTLDSFIRRHFPPANWTAGESGLSAHLAVGRDNKLSEVTGNFCPEDPETRIAEGLGACGHAEQVLGQRSCLSALSSMLLLDESQQFPGRTQVVLGWFWFCFASPLVSSTLLLSCFLFPCFPLCCSTPLSD